MTYTDEQIARQLEELLNTIQAGNDSANQVLEKAQTIRNQVFQSADQVLQQAQTIREEVSQFVELKKSEILLSQQQASQSADQVLQQAQTIRNNVSQSANQVLQQAQTIRNQVSQSADQVLQQAQTIREEVSQFVEIRQSEILLSQEQVSQFVERTQSEILRIAEQVINTEQEVQNWRSEIQENRNEVVTTVADIANRETIERVRQEIETARTQITVAQTRFQQIDSRLPAFGQELQQRLARASELASQIANDRNTVSQLAQQTDDRANQILQVQSVIQQSHQELLSVVNEIGGTQGLEQLRQEYQAVRHTLSETLQTNQQLNNEAEQRLNALRDQTTSSSQRVEELISTAQSALVTQAISQVEEAQRRVQLQEEQVLNQLRTLVTATLTQLGGQAGLESLRQELQQAHQLHQELVSVVNEIGGTQGLEQLRQEYQAVRHTLSETLQTNQQLNNEAEQKLNALQKHAAITHQRFMEIQELISTAQSALVTQAISQVEEAQRRVQLQEEQVLNQLRTMVATTLTELGGQAGLEKLRRELQEGHQVLGEIQRVNQQLNSGIGVSLSQLQDMLKVHTAVQEKVSELKTMHSEVSDQALQVRLDKEAVQTLRAEVETFSTEMEKTKNALVIELRGEIRRLQRDLQQLRTQGRSQQNLRNLLFAITFSTAVLALTLAVVH